MKTIILFKSWWGEKRGLGQLSGGWPGNKKCIGLPADIQPPCCTNRSWHHPSTHFSRLHTNWNKPRWGQRWLLRQIATIQRTELTILAGDINVHIGTNRDSWQETMGKFGVGKINDNGLCLLLFTSPRPSLSLVIASSNIVACVPGWPAQRGRWGCGI